jgi:hypothetical protein
VSNLKTFKQFLAEYELTDDVIPSHVKEEDIEHNDYNKHELGDVDGHRVVHYESKNKKGSHHTFVTNKAGESVGHIEHKKTPTAKNEAGRLAISNVTKTKGAPFDMGNVLHHLVKHGHSLESDNTNTEHGAHKMLMKFAARKDINTHIVHGNTGEVVPHKGDITSPENQKKYTVKSTDANFLAPSDETHKHILVMNKKT